MKDICRQIQEQIPLYIYGNLSEQQQQAVRNHIAQCEQCHDYLQAFEQDDKLINEYVSSMRPFIGRIEKEVIKAVEHKPQQRKIGTIQTSKRSRFIQYATAAAVFITVGFLIGRVTTSRDINRMRNELKVSLAGEIKEEVSEQLKGDLQTAFVVGFEQVRDGLRNEYQQDLNRYAIQTLAASNAVTNQLLTELISAIDTSRAQDHRGIAAAMEQMELNRLRDNKLLANGIQTLAYQTEDQLLRTRQDMARLLVNIQPSNLD